MALEESGKCCFDGDFEFDAPQWIDLESEKDHLESDTNNDQYDWWFQKVHPLHSPNLNATPEPQPKPKKRPLRKSVLGNESSKLSTETGKSSFNGKSSLPGHKSSFTSKSGFASKSSLTGKSSLSGKTTLSNPKQESESRTSKGNGIDETDTASSNQGDEVVKKPRKCWQLNGHSSLSFSPQCLSALPLDLQPKRASSNSLSNKTSWTALPARGSTDIAASPLTAGSPSKKPAVKNKNLKSLRRSCPAQKLQKSKQAWNESSTKSKKDDDYIDEELQKIIEQHNRKILSQQSQYDLNGRRIKKTASPLKPSKKENLRAATATKVDQTIEIDDELREIINNHNRRIWTAQNSEYDLNGRRVRKGNATVATPATKTKSEAHSTPKRSNETNQKRKNPTKNSEVNSKFNKTVAASHNVESSTDFENEIQEIINLHNSRLAAKKAKK